MENRAYQIFTPQNTDPATGCLCHFVYGKPAGQRQAHYHDFYEFFLVTQGVIDHRINGQTQRLPAGSLVFIRPEDTHLMSIAPKAEGAFVNFAFDCDTAELIFTLLGEGFQKQALLRRPMPPVATLGEKEKNKLLHRMEKLYCVDAQDKPKLKTRMRVLLAEIFSEYFDDMDWSEAQNIPYWLEYVCQQMRKQKNFCAGIDRMVELSGKSREHLGRSLKRYYGLSTTEFINDLRLNWAANMLLGSTMPVVELCYECGFQNISWFYAAFRKKYGVTPRQYRAGQ